MVIGAYEAVAQHAARGRPQRSARVHKGWGRRDLRLPNELAKLDRFDLIILDDLSYARRDQAETSVLFELIAERYERKSIAITANAPFSAWDEVFPSSFRSRPIHLGY